MNHRLVHPVRGAGGGDVALDVGPLLVRLVRADTEVLHGPGVDDPEHDGRQQHQGEADGRHHPAPQHGVGEEQQGADHGDHRQDHLGVHGGVGGGVVDAGEDRHAGHFEAVLVEPVVDALHQHREADEDGQVRLGGRTAAPPGPAEAQGPGQVVHDGGHDGGEPEHGEGERQDEAPPRVVEDEEADVEAELRVGDAERGRVPPGEIGLGLTGRRTAGEQPDQHPEPDHDPDRPGLEQLAVPLQQLATAAGRTQARADPVGDGGVRHHDRGHDQAEGGEQADPGQQHRAEHRPVVERVEPQPVGPEVDEDREAHHQRCHHKQGR